MIQKEILSNTEQKIIDTATVLFAQKGYDATSTRDICSAAGVNISSISYYFRGKEELYQKIVESITGNVILHMQSAFSSEEIHKAFGSMSKNQKIELFLGMIEHIIDYFYSDKISIHSIMIIFREQITSGVNLNAIGYKMFKKLLASILEKDENDKEVIFRCLTIFGQIHSARVLTQFSLKMMNQSEYTSEDVKLFKNIVITQTKSILAGLDGGNA